MARENRVRKTNLATKARASKGASRLSPEGREAISQAAKLRWEIYRAEKARAERKAARKGKRAPARRKAASRATKKRRAAR